MKFPLVFIPLLIAFTNCFSQTTSIEYTQPQFIGGKKAFFTYLGKYLYYPPAQQAGHIQDNLKATIYISKEGKVKFVNVIGDIKEFKDQVKRVLTLMPDWKPAKLNNNPIDTFITQEVFYSLQDSRIKKKDTLTYECLIYSMLMSSKEVYDMEKKWKEEADKKKQAKNLYQQGIAEIDKNNYSAAIGFLKQAEKNGYTTNSIFHYNMGIAYLKSGIKDTACINFLESARQGDTDSFNLYLKICK